MKKCFTINPLRTIDEIRSYQQLFENDYYQGIEIFFPYTQSLDKFNAYTEAVKELINKYPKLEVVMHLPYGKDNDLCNLKSYKKNVERMKLAIAYASTFKTKKLTLHLGYVDKNISRDVYVDHIVKVLVDLTEYANRYGMLLMIENMPNDAELGYSPKEIKMIIDKVREVDSNLNNLKFIIDTGHANLSKYSLDEYLNILGTELVHIHLNDNKGKKDEHAPLGSGNINFKKFFKKLEEISYKELYCMEVLYNDVNDLIKYYNTLKKYDK